MIAAHIEEGEVSVRSLRKPARRPGHALIRLLCGGICNTDIELLRGYYGFRGTPGHEFVGEVVEADDRSWTGKRVVGEINLACGRCEWCSRGLGRHCPRRTVLGIVRHPGAFAEYLTLPVANLFAVPKGVQTHHAVFTEPVAAACEILEQVAIPRGAQVAVLGDGKLGLLIAQVLAAHGAQVQLYGHHRRKLKIAALAGVEGRIVSRYPRAAYEWCVEATGSAQGLNAAVRMTKPRGTLVLKSTVHGEVPLDTAPVIVNEITMVGSRCGRFEQALKLLRSGKLHLDEMVDAEFPLSDATRAFAAAQRRGALKVLLEA
jgi:threonine dehydrogenase-like Zn-dependent dehydrogenase